jgi:general secretion pathway protein G
MKTTSPRLKAKGFTLIEILVTMAIIAILAAMSIGGFQYVTAKQKFSTAELQINLLSKALEEYKLDNGEYPNVTTTNELYRALYWDGEGAEGEEGEDADDNQKIYLAELNPKNNSQKWTLGDDGADASARNPDFDLVSKGPDKDENVEGDNVSNF